MVEHVKITHPDFYVLFRLKASQILPEKCATCGWHFTAPADLQAHNPDECKKCLAMKRAFIIGLDPDLSCGPKSPTVSTGRDSHGLEMLISKFLKMKKLPLFAGKYFVPCANQQYSLILLKCNYCCQLLRSFCFVTGISYRNIQGRVGAELFYSYQTIGAVGGGGVVLRPKDNL